MTEGQTFDNEEAQEAFTEEYSRARMMERHAGHKLRCIETAIQTLSFSVSPSAHSIKVWDTRDVYGLSDYREWECLDCDAPITDEAVNALDVDYF